MDRGYGEEELRRMRGSLDGATTYVRTSIRINYSPLVARRLEESMWEFDKLLAENSKRREKDVD